MCTYYICFACRRFIPYSKPKLTSMAEGTEEQRSCERESTPLRKNESSSSISTSSSVSLSGDVASTGPGPAEKLWTYWWRWWVLAEFVALVAFTNAQWMTFASIANVIACYYETSDFWVNSLSMTYMATYVVFVVPSALMLSRLGLRTTFITAACANAAGACLRWAGSGRSRPCAWVSGCHISLAPDYEGEGGGHTLYAFHPRPNSLEASRS